MSLNATSLGPVSREVRNRVKEFQDQREDLSNYNETIKALLEEADA